MAFLLTIMWTNILSLTFLVTTGLLSLSASPVVSNKTLTTLSSTSSLAEVGEGPSLWPIIVGAALISDTCCLSENYCTGGLHLKALRGMSYAPVLEVGRRLVGGRPLRRLPRVGSSAFFHLLLLDDMVAMRQPVPKLLLEIVQGNSESVGEGGIAQRHGRSQK